MLQAVGSLCRSPGAHRDGWQVRRVESAVPALVRFACGPFSLLSASLAGRSRSCPLRLRAVLALVRVESAVPALVRFACGPFSLLSASSRPFPLLSASLAGCWADSSGCSADSPRRATASWCPLARPPRRVSGWAVRCLAVRRSPPRRTRSRGPRPAPSPGA